MIRFFPALSLSLALWAVFLVGVKMAAVTVVSFFAEVGGVLSIASLFH